MKNKIIIDVLVPSVDETYNVFIPVNKTVGEIIKLLNIAINELTDGDFPIKNDLSLIDLCDGIIYSTDYNVKSNKIKNGTKLALI